MKKTYIQPLMKVTTSNLEDEIMNTISGATGGVGNDNDPTDDEGGAKSRPFADNEWGHLW